MERQGYRVIGVSPGRRTFFLCIYLAKSKRDLVFNSLNDRWELKWSMINCLEAMLTVEFS